MTQYELYVEHPEGWEYQGNCSADSVMTMAQVYGAKSETRLLFTDTLIPRPLATEQKYEAYLKGWLTFDLDNTEHILIQSMFKGFADILIMPRQEILNDFKFNGLELSGYSRPATDT